MEVVDLVEVSARGDVAADETAGRWEEQGLPPRTPPWTWPRERPWGMSLRTRPKGVRMSGSRRCG